jgi:hypothetical protein
LCLEVLLQRFGVTPQYKVNALLLVNSSSVALDTQG